MQNQNKTCSLVFLTDQREALVSQFETENLKLHLNEKLHVNLKIETACKSETASYHHVKRFKTALININNCQLFHLRRDGFTFSTEL